SDVVLPGIDEGEFLFGENEPKKLAKKFNNNGSSTIVIKLERKGAYYYTESQEGFVSSFPVNRVIDPVGAGDGFASGFLSGLLDGLSLENSVRRGNGVGALVIMNKGDVEGL